MWAAIRLVRASRVFGTIFLSYLWSLSWSMLWRKRYDTPERWRKRHRRNARRMYKGFVSLRGVYIKLGQILSIMGTFLPRSYTEELEGLQDEVPARPTREMTRAFEKSFGVHPAKAFASFSEKPIAAASLGQVHEARTADGKRLAVKILYPNVATIIKIDLRVLGWALRVYRTFVPIKQIEKVHAQLRDMLERETDLVNEARCIKAMAANFADDADTIFPEVHTSFCSKTVLTMSFMDGVKISKKNALAELGLDPYAVATKLTQVFYKQLFIDRFFHADPHPGNFFVQRNEKGQPRIVVLDLGSATPLAANLADGMLDILQGMMVKKDDLVIRGIETMGFIAEDGDRGLLERTVRTYFEKLLDLKITDFSRLDTEAASQHFAGAEMKREDLRELMKSIAYPDGWFYVERAAVIMFGLSSQLAPKLNTVQVGFPYVMKFIAASAAAKVEKAKAEAKAAAEAAEEAVAATSNPAIPVSELRKAAAAGDPSA